jgi:hypothetical protein
MPTKKGYIIYYTNVNTAGVVLIKHLRWKDK